MPRAKPASTTAAPEAAEAKTPVAAPSPSAKQPPAVKAASPVAPAKSDVKVPPKVPSRLDAPPAKAPAKGDVKTAPPVNKTALAKAVEESKEQRVPVVENGTSSDDLDCEALWHKIKSMSEQEQRELVNGLTDDQALKLSQYSDPLKFTADTKDRDALLAVSMTDLRGEYQKKFLMTTLVAFLYTVAKEYEVPEDARRWVPKADAGTEQERAAPDPSKLLELLKNTANVAEEAVRLKKEMDDADIAARAAEAKFQHEYSLAEVELLTEHINRKTPAPKKANAAAKIVLTPALAKLKKAADDARAAAHVAAEGYVGVLYAATSSTAKIGLGMAKRVDGLAEECKKYENTRKILETNRIRADAHSAVTMPADRAHDILTQFLNKWFAFDPTVHVKSAHDKKRLKTRRDVITDELVDVNDPERLPLRVIKDLAPKPPEADEPVVEALTASEQARAAALTCMRTPGLVAHIAAAVKNTERFRRYLAPIAPKSAVRKALDIIPPQDTFHRLQYFQDVQYENLRIATDALYLEKSDIETALGVWEYFPGPRAKAEEEFKAWRSAHESTVPSDILCVPVGAWTLVAPFAKNRERVDFYNRETGIIKSILDRHAEDKKLGGELMRKRVAAAKAKNIREDGADAPGLKDYRRGDPARVAAGGAQKVISQDDMKRLEDAQGDPRAAEERRVLDELLAQEAEFERILRSRNLTPEEATRRKRLVPQIKQAREALEIPDDAVQVDVFEMDGKSLTKSKFYTKAEAPADPNDPAVIAAAAAARPGVPKYAEYARRLIDPPAESKATVAVKK